MIPLNEYRLGIWVEDAAPWTGYFQVDLGMLMRAIGNNRQYRPIPLTPEWLERCGFVKSSSYIGIGYHWDGPNDISIVQQQVDKEDTYRLYGSEWAIGKDFKYLHQLQNLYFALTGEELEIKMS